MNLFIKKFFQDFYEKEKLEYEMIYKECSIKRYQKAYCYRYDKLNYELGKDLFTIKDKIHELLEYKEIPAP